MASLTFGIEELGFRNVGKVYRNLIVEELVERVLAANEEKLVEYDAMSVDVHKAWQSLFIKYLSKNATAGELENFAPEFMVIVADEYYEKEFTSLGLKSRAFVVIDLSKKNAIIAGTAHSEEIKKCIFSIANFFFLKKESYLCIVLLFLDLITISHCFLEEPVPGIQHCPQTPIKPSGTEN